MHNLTANQYERLRHLVRRSPVFIGMRIAVHEDEVEVLEPEQLVIGLGPVVDAVDGAPMDQWADLVDACLERIVTALTGGSDADLPTEQLLDRVYARVRPADGSPVEWWSYAREVAPGLLLVLAIDHPEHIAILNDEQVRRHGFDRLMDAGLHNLCGQLPTELAASDDVFVFTGGDYVASTVLVMPYVVEAVTGSPESPYGVLVAMPNHGMLVFHVLREGADAQFALREIAELAAEHYEEAASSGPAQVSPAVYWWQPGSPVLEPVAHHDDSGTGVIGDSLVTRFPPGFGDLIEQLTSPSHVRNAW
ncbi:hypothetical protein [Amycolatopsis magusensis]|uniref:Uncharacterized protein n=1 Tax=Amycolatopsis magusensis TaxID=882444 RepID=A0ABS4PT30_9PSEU|nr:hypothetical protein [Amycolatopsis magusensis]MBP2182586.1 hypothetical protein [Amycolatopsis magusensis]